MKNTIPYQIFCRVKYNLVTEWRLADWGMVLASWDTRS